MRTVRHLACTTLVLSIVAAPTYAQSLGELARQEEVRRATTTKAVKSLSHADLNPQDITSPSARTPVEACYMSIIQGRCVSAEELIFENRAGFVSKENAFFEQNWRSDAASLRSRTENAQDAVASLEAVTADEGRSPADRKSPEKALLALRQEVSVLERKWEKFAASAANQHIPREWIEPIPALTTRNPQLSGKRQ